MLITKDGVFLFTCRTIISAEEK